jgi:hypothetical protein
MMKDLPIKEFEMNEMVLSFDAIESMNFGAGIHTLEELKTNICDESMVFGPYDAAEDYVSGPVLDRFFNEEIMTCEIEDEVIEIPVSEIRIFNTNKEIKNSDFFTEAQADFVINVVKRHASDYYKTWSSGYRSRDKEFVEILEVLRGAFFSHLKFSGAFNHENLFFIQADVLPFKEDSIIAAVGYKNPDGTISYSNFETDDFDSYGEIMKYKNDEYSWEEFKEIIQDK